MTARCFLIVMGAFGVLLAAMSGCRDVDIDVNLLHEISCGDDCTVPPEVCDPGEVQTAYGCMGCDQAWDLLFEEVHQTVADNSEGCVTDADCTFAKVDTGCHHSCPASVFIGSEPSFYEDLALVSDEICSDPGFTEVCGFITADCATAEPVCIDGHCDLIVVDY